MTNVILREAVLPRMDGIRKNVERLRRLGRLDHEELVEEDNLALVQHYLRLSLEGVFNIGNHILSRVPGGRATEYKGIARRLGDVGVVPKEFAEQHLVPMAGMRNLLVHEYDDIDTGKLKETLEGHLDDFDEFLRFVAELLKDPARLGLEVN